MPKKHLNILLLSLRCKYESDKVLYSLIFEKRRTFNTMSMKCPFLVPRFLPPSQEDNKSGLRPERLDKAYVKGTDAFLCQLRTATN
jgi:hypothetical protein